MRVWGYISTLKIEDICDVTPCRMVQIYIDISKNVTTYQCRQRNISKDLKLLQQRSENFKSYIKYFFDSQTNDNHNWKET
jgi:succinyl-CoA synthetase beta subunit